MSRLDNGNEQCDKCNRLYIPLLGDKGCECVVERPEKALPPDKMTVMAFKYKKRAIEAERVNKVLYDALSLIAKDRGEPLILEKTWQKTSYAWQHAWSTVTNIAVQALK